VGFASSDRSAIMKTPAAVPARGGFHHILHHMLHLIPHHILRRILRPLPPRPIMA